MRLSSVVVTAVVVVFPYKGSLSAQQPSAPLFQEHTPLTLRLEGDFKGLFKDRGEKRTAHPARLRYATATDSGKIDVKLRTRGIFRLKTCAFPPIRIDLPTHKVDGTAFAGQDKLKLATHCMSARSYEHQLLREYAVYRVFNALTDSSFRVRLAHVTYIDSARTDTVIRYGFLIEPEGELARRLGGQVYEGNSVHDLLTDPVYMTLAAMFEYFIGNTDWSVWGRHNIVLVKKTEPPVMLAIPYDFDFSGAVNAPYASPPPQLPIHSVRERYYRGYCQPDSILTAVLARFRAAKDSIYAAVRAVPDLPEGDMKGLLGYFKDFYAAIDDRGLVQREFVRGCRRVEQ